MKSQLFPLGHSGRSPDFIHSDISERVGTTEESQGGAYYGRRTPPHPGTPRYAQGDVFSVRLSFPRRREFRRGGSVDSQSSWE